MPGSTLSLLLRVGGGGKRARDSITELTKEEKGAMIKHQLTVLVGRVPPTKDKMLLDLHKNIMIKVEELVESQDAGFITSKINTMSEETLMPIKEFYGTVVLGDQSAFRLSRYFLEEVKLLEHGIDVMQKLSEVLHKTFELVLSWCVFTNGRYNFRDVKSQVEKQLGVIKVLRDHGHMQESNESFFV